LGGLQGRKKKKVKIQDDKITGDSDIRGNKSKEGGRQTTVESATQKNRQKRNLGGKRKKKKL